MRHRTLSLPLVLTLLSLPLSASAGMYLQAVGSVQGTILGGSTASGHVNWIDAFSFSQGIEIPIGPDGLPTGPARTSPLVLVKAFDRSSVKLITAASTNEAFTDLRLELTEPNQTGQQVVYYRIVLTDARLISHQQSGTADALPTESVSFSYSSITLTDVVRGISVSYPWHSSGATATATPGQLAKGILLPPAPNPTRGETRFRFLLPGGSSAELAVFDAQGRLVRELHHGWSSAEAGIAVWDGTDDRGVKVAPGVYMARLTSPGSEVTQRFAVVR